MISNPEQLKVVRKQLETATAALESLREEVYPQNPQMYELMAESYVDMVLSLRGEIDTYLGIAAVPEDADLVISLEGRRVGLGRTSAALVTRFVDTFRRGLQWAVEVVESVNRPEAARRRGRWIEGLCDLSLVGVGPGSVRILLGEPESQSLFSEEDRQAFSKALDLVFEGLAWADTVHAKSSGDPFAQFPEETRQSLLSLISRLLPPRSGDVEQVAFARRPPAEGEGHFLKATLTRGSRNRIREALEDLASDREFAELEGVIRSVDLDAQTFVLRERPGGEPDLSCEYSEFLEDAVKEFLDVGVIVAGTLETSRKTKKSLLSADAIEPVAKAEGDPSTSTHGDDLLSTTGTEGT